MSLKYINIYYKLVDVSTGEIWTSTGVEGGKFQAIDLNVKMDAMAGPAGITIQVPTQFFEKGQRLRAYEVINGQEVLLVSGIVVTESWDGDLYSYAIVDDNNFNLLVPGRIYGRACSFSFGKGACLYNIDANKISVNITDVGQNYVKVDADLSSNYRELVQSGISEVAYQVSGQYLYMADPDEFEVGAADVRPVCEKTFSDCVKYGQVENFGGFLYIPKAGDIVF